MVERERTILIVDDEKAIRDLLHERLEIEGYHCEEVGNAGEALTHLQDSYADLVLLDIKMPGKSGMELLPEIKEHYPHVVVIMATVVGDAYTAVKCMREGAYDYITKPFRLDEVVHAVKKAVEQRRLELELQDYQRHLKQKVEEQAKEIRKLFLGAIEALVFALEAKDRYTAGHSRRVTEIAMAIGTELGLSADDTEDLHWGSLLHDVGKIAIDQLIQNKPGRLTPEEYEHIMTHAHVGAGIVKPVVNENIIKMIEHHHDRYDGGGLHQVVAGCDTPLAARILALADAFDAMTSDRPYRAAMSREEALNEIKRCTGTQFDPVVVTAFLKTAITRGVPTKT